MAILTMALSGCGESYPSDVPNEERRGIRYIHIEDLHHRPVVGANVLVESTWASTNITGGYGGRSGTSAETKISNKNGDTHFLLIGSGPVMTITKDGYRTLRLGVTLGTQHSSSSDPDVIIYGSLEELNGRDSKSHGRP